MKSLPWATTLAAGLLLAACGEQQAQKTSLDSEQQRFSYAVGYQLGQELKGQNLDLDAQSLALALEDVLAGAAARLSATEMQGAIRKRLEERAKEQERVAQVNQEAGRLFLEENAKEAGVVTLPSGLQYKVIQEGTGRKPGPSDQVKVQYRGTFINGHEFDSSYGRGEPATLRVEQVIQGWQEALPLMPEGARWQIFVPPELAYGARGADDTIGPNETLIFDIELISIL
jgi:FKBP-type peptidyl-prolyl cis-trans isomerase FklB